MFMDICMSYFFYRKMNFITNNINQTLIQYILKDVRFRVQKFKICHLYCVTKYRLVLRHNYV